ncbi:hypothetical protein [Polaribacter sp. P097]|uniref:hypothetical protein n=1 Tax=Polaribacter sp. P097 TaxID=3117398 RepID=UPI002FE05F7A
MKKLKILILTSVVMISFGLLNSCSEEVTTSENSNLIEYKESFKLNATKSRKSSVNSVYNVTVLYNDSLDEVVDYEFSNNLYEDLNITREELDQFIQKEIYGNFDNKTSKKGDDGPPDNHTGCIEWCKDKYTDKEGDKIKGRGACKANCWVDTVIRAVDAILPL